MTTTWNPEQRWQLGKRDRQSGAGLETRQDTIADQFDKYTKPENPGYMQNNPTANAAPMAIAIYRAVSPPAISLTVAAIISEIAEVGPIARYRDEPATA